MGLQMVDQMVQKKVMMKVDLMAATTVALRDCRMVGKMVATMVIL